MDDSLTHTQTIAANVRPHATRRCMPLPPAIRLGAELAAPGRAGMYTWHMYRRFLMAFVNMIYGRPLIWGPLGTIRGATKGTTSGGVKGGWWGEGRLVGVTLAVRRALGEADKSWGGILEGGGGELEPVVR